jgi:hypothetical protein
MRFPAATDEPGGCVIRHAPGVAAVQVAEQRRGARVSLWSGRLAPSGSDFLIAGDSGWTSTTGSLALAPRDANLDSPRRDLGIFLFPHEVDLGRSDISMAGELAHLVQSTVTMHLK